MLTELARRGGATPLAEWREFIDAFLRSVGVAEREGVDAPCSGLRRELPGRGVLGDLLTAGLKGLEGRPGLGDERVELADGEVASESCLRECASSSPVEPGPLLTLNPLVGGDGEGEELDAILMRRDNSTLANPQDTGDRHRNKAKTMSGLDLVVPIAV